MLNYTPADGAQATELEGNPLEAMYKKDVETEFADWYPGMDMFTANSLDFFERGKTDRHGRTYTPFKVKVKLLVTFLLSAVGVAETYSYAYTLYQYFKYGDYVWGALSLASLILYTLYVAVIVGRKVSWEGTHGGCSFIGGFFLSVIQLAHPYLIWDTIFGTTNILGESSSLILSKMEIFKVATFSLPQAVLQLYLFLGKHRDALPSVHNLNDFDNAREIFSICSSLVLTSLTIAAFYRNKKSGKIYSVITILYSLSSTVLRVLMYCTVAAVFKWVVFVLFALGVFIRCFICHARPGDPYANKFVYFMSGLMFSFVINVDPNVPYIPILFLADLEAIIYIALAIYLPKRYHITFVYVENFVFDDYWTRIIEAAIVLLIVMNLTFFIVTYKVRKMHIDNLSTIFYRFANYRTKAEFENPFVLPERYANFADKSALQTPAQLRRYRFDNPKPRELVKYRMPKNSKTIQTFTQQFKCNPRCTEILAFRAEKFMEEGKLREAVADCTFGLNPYFGLHYQDVGITFNRLVYAPKNLPNGRKLDGTDHMITRFLITRIACLIDLNEPELASLDRRRLAIVAKIQSNDKVIQMLLDNPFPNKDNTKFLEVDDNLRSLFL